VEDEGKEEDGVEEWEPCGLPSDDNKEFFPGL